MAEFHFLRPWWLIALPFGVWLIWRLFWAEAGRKSGWRAVVDEALQPYVLGRVEALVNRRWPMLVALAAWLAAVLALAGPTWERMPVPAFRSDEALVVVFDLSRSMDAADLEPSRLDRAKVKLLSLLERRASGQTALVVFSAHAFTVTPLTADTDTIASLVGALSSDIMPSRGSLAEAGLQRAGMLLRQTGLTAGEVLLVTDAEVSSRAQDIVRELRQERYITHVLAVGTEEGAPIREPDGGFVTDASGRVVVPGVDVAALRSLATAGGGRFARLAASDRDLEVLFPDTVGAGSFSGAADDEQEYEADIWRDQGVWLTLAALPFLALMFRRGWICVLLVGLVAPMPRADAFEWRDLWVRADRQGFEAMQADDPERALALFEDPAWLGAAQYRVGDYSGSVATLSELDSSEANYNRGNALARSGELAGAIEAYDRTLVLDPEHDDARFNRELVAELLAQIEQESEAQSRQGEEGQQQSDPNEEGRSNRTDETSESGEPTDSEDGSSDRQQRSQADSSNSRDSEQREPSDDPGENGQDPSEALDAAAGEEESPDFDPDSLPGPEEIEQWASEQAADQWLRRIPQDPGGLLRRKFLYQYQRLGVDQDGNFVWPGDESAPW